MPASSTPAEGADSTAGLGRIFVLILLVEAASIAALYWFGVAYR